MLPLSQREGIDVRRVGWLYSTQYSDVSVRLRLETRLLGRVGSGAIQEISLEKQTLRKTDPETSSG